MQLFSIAFDVGYACRECQTSDLVLDDDIDSRTWTCKSCGQSADIELERKNGGKYFVQRVPVSTIEVGERVVLADSTTHQHLVLASNKGKGKKSSWYIAFEGHGHEIVAPSTFYNRLH